MKIGGVGKRRKDRYDKTMINYHISILMRRYVHGKYMGVQIIYGRCEEGKYDKAPLNKHPSSVAMHLLLSVEKKFFFFI